MATLSPSVSAHSADESPSPSPEYHRSRSASEKQRDDAKIVFNKTIDGRYRHGKTGYRQVGALFLTWKDDDMQCKETEVDKLRQLFASAFNFKTVYFEIPSERWETALHKAVADFCYEYDSPEDLAIVYYGGHAYEGKETKHFKLAAAGVTVENPIWRFDNRDGNGDPKAFFPDVLTCLRLPACDQLLILDCCFAAKAFARESIGKRKFELLTSAAHNARSPAPHSAHSFTKTLTDALRSLLDEKPKGFCTSDLYREVYHTIPPHPATTKPLLFDQSRHNFGKIWLMPQVLSDRPPKTNEEEGEEEEDGRFLKLTFRLNKSPDLAVMNELALNLQYLPYVDQIKFEDLYAPREQISNFMKSVVQARKIKPLIRKLQAKRKFQDLTTLKNGSNGVKPPESLLKLHLEQNHHPIYDWSHAERVQDHGPESSKRSRDRRRKTSTWPPVHRESDFAETLTTECKVDGPGTFITNFVPRRAHTMDAQAHEQANETTASAETDQLLNRDGRKRQRSPAPNQDNHPSKRSRMID